MGSQNNQFFCYPGYILNTALSEFSAPLSHNITSCPCGSRSVRMAAFVLASMEEVSWGVYLMCYLLKGKNKRAYKFWCV